MTYSSYIEKVTIRGIGFAAKERRKKAPNQKQKKKINSSIAVSIRSNREYHALSNMVEPIYNIWHGVTYFSTWPTLSSVISLFLLKRTD